jgi:membrane-associated phospholipid phosphatase
MSVQAQPHTAAGVGRPRGRPAARPGAPRAAGALGLAGLLLVALALTWVAAELVPAGHVRDATTLHDFTLLGRPRVDALAHGLLGLLDPLPFTVAAAALITVALARRRPRVALAVALVLVLSPVSADLLKPLLAHPHASVDTIHVTQASWPSGHAAAALALVLCALLVAPEGLRPAVATIGGLFVVAIGISLLILAWHLPSDVLGGYLVAALWAALAVAALRAGGGRRASVGPRLRSGGARMGLGAVSARVPE